MLSITVMPQQMYDIFLAHGFTPEGAKAIILDLLLTSDGGGLKDPEPEIQEEVVGEEGEAEELGEVEVQSEPVATSKRKTPRRINFSAFGGSAESLK